MHQLQQWRMARVYYLPPCRFRMRHAIMWHVIMSVRDLCRSFSNFPLCLRKLWLFLHTRVVYPGFHHMEHTSALMITQMYIIKAYHYYITLWYAYSHGFHTLIMSGTSSSYFWKAFIWNWWGFVDWFSIAKRITKAVFEFHAAVGVKIQTLFHH